MTKRERLLAVIKGDEVDRVPVSPFIWGNYIGEFFGSQDVDMVEKGIEVYKHYGFDIMLRTCGVAEFGDEKTYDSKKWRVTEVIEHLDDRKWEIVTIIRTPERELIQRKGFCRITPYEVVEAPIEYFIKDEEDFKQFVKYQPPVPECDCSIVGRALELLGDEGIAAPWIQGAFNSLGMVRRLDDLLMDPYINPEFFAAMCDYFPGRTREIARQLIKAGADLLCAGGNMATATMVGPIYYKNFILAMEIEHCRKVKEMGGAYLYHNCGDAAALLPLYSDIKMNVYESMTPPPYGDTDFDTALSTIDKSITLCGNLDQVSFLKEATLEEIEERVKEILKKAKKRGNFILATTDYFSEGTPEENIHAFAQAGLKYGRY
jgi:uroporphyrinogen decarboxylase